jgi:glutamine synthetase
MGLVKRKSSGNLIELAQNEIEFKRDKASKIIDKNSTSKLLSKSALKKTNKKLM